MAKKKSRKKHQFKYAEPTSAATATPKPAVTSSATSARMATGGLQYQVNNLDLIKGDIRKVAILATSFVLLQLVLWFVFNHTGLGPAVYHLVQV